MRNIRLTIEYDGTDFSGWSIQPGKRTVQGTIENSIKELTGSEHRLYAASRTDAGVHAEGQAANFITASKMPADRMARCLSKHLPRDVVVRKAEYVPRSFNSRRDAKGKTDFVGRDRVHSRQGNVVQPQPPTAGSRSGRYRAAKLGGAFFLRLAGDGRQVPDAGCFSDLHRGTG